ncbi:hypothetical protein KQ313_01415 [Synechococcus sp. CS-1325]|uniref:hypothetical protein n=1 Tax=Synechococcus sp. CS-1325 TaxID=2847979 RepID=UPI000DB4BAA4|nr:hypothetical protein [Synechococcus sp. CS-1325]MCT0198347.1 hypothetical protein [Synechococcus sp. CS-1325]PZV00205.1 MAG: hypothetical protein DCF24_07700 [Cyanobium sp.]
MTTLSWSLTAQVAGGASITDATAPLPVEATDQIFVTVEPGDTDRVVEIQPGASSAIRLMVVKSSRCGEDLSFKASDGTTPSGLAVLDAPQVFTSGSIALFGVAPRRLLVTIPAGGLPAELVIFVARDATPP